MCMALLGPFQGPSAVSAIKICLCGAIKNISVELQMRKCTDDQYMVYIHGGAPVHLTGRLVYIDWGVLIGDFCIYGSAEVITREVLIPGNPLVPALNCHPTETPEFPQHAQ